MSEERRRGKRVKENFSVIYKAFKPVEAEGNLKRIIDFSRVGICFISDDILTPGDLLHLIFRIPPDFKKRLELFGRIVDCQKESQGKFKVHVAFIDINDQDKSALDKSIEQISPNPQ